MTRCTYPSRIAVCAIGMVMGAMLARAAYASCGDGVIDAGEQCEIPFTSCCNPGSCTFWGGANQAAFDASTGHCYLGFHTLATWPAAKAACEGLGAHLAVIEGPSENAIARTASDLNLQAWIGFSDSAAEAGKDAFAFATVTGGPLTFNGFRPNEPNSENPDEDCVHFFEHRYDWNDGGCGTPYPYVCERDLPPTGSTPCTSTPATGCLPSKHSTLHLKRGAKPAADVLSFAWTKGPATTKADFGTPTGTDAYTLCIYNNGALFTSAQVAAGGTCGTKPCWKSDANGYEFKDPSAAQNGIRAISLASSPKAKSHATVTGKGVNLPDPPLGGLQVVSAKLVHGGSGRCFEAAFVGAALKKNTSTELKGVIP